MGSELVDNLPPAAGVMQFDVREGEVRQNLNSVQQLLGELQPMAGAVIVLPELWASGFAYDRLADMAAQTAAMLAELQRLAARYGITIAGSLLEKAAGSPHYYNSLFFTGGSGTIGIYRKQQLFGPMAEDRYLQPGSSPEPILSPAGNFAGLVCYDLRFPELARLQVSRGAQLLVISAQWPAVRQEHWQTLLRARAIENQVFVVACNRCGTTGNTEFGGHSAIIGPDGQVLSESGPEQAATQVRLDRRLLSASRARFNTVGPSPYRFSDQDKIQPLAALQARLAMLKALGKKIVFTNGCFDILHQGHVSYLEEARKQGDCLVVGLNSDSSIRAIKGPDRPVNNEASRARVLAALGAVDFVTLFTEETPHSLILALLPDMLVKGADWPVAQIVGASEVLAHGGQVVNVPLVAEFSTSGLIAKIRGD